VLAIKTYKVYEVLYRSEASERIPQKYLIQGGFPAGKTGIKQKGRLVATRRLLRAIAKRIRDLLF
jgi:hypothetical protein